MCLVNRVACGLVWISVVVTGILSRAFSLTRFVFYCLTLISRCLFVVYQFVAAFSENIDLRFSMVGDLGSMAKVS